MHPASSDSPSRLPSQLATEQKRLRRTFEAQQQATTSTPARPKRLLDGEGAERRRDPRASITRKAAMGFADQRNLVMGTAQNLSMGGVCTWGPLSAAPGDEVMVLLSLKGRTVPAFATVVAAERFSRDSVELRMQFSRLPSLTRDGIEEFFRDLTPIDEAEEPPFA